MLQEPGRDLRPDTVIPSPDLTSTEAGALESLEEFVTNEGLASQAATDQAQTSAPAVLENAASSESTDEEKQDASRDAGN